MDSNIPEIPYIYMLCVPVYSSTKHCVNSYTGGGARTGEQSGRVYDVGLEFDTVVWKDTWKYYFNKGGFYD